MTLKVCSLSEKERVKVIRERFRLQCETESSRQKGDVKAFDKIEARTLLKMSMRVVNTEELLGETKDKMDG